LHVEDTSSLLVGLALLGILIIVPILVLILLLRHKSFLEIRIILPWVWTLPREMPRLSAIIAGIVVDVVALRGWGTNDRGIQLSWIW
jgi:uncharacterized integral membrane protein